jgi:aspartyl/asparaginyl beta-hydroxylase (cupin superfamily)
MLRKTMLRAARRLRRTANRLFYEHAGGEDRPVFFEVEDVCPELALVAENYDAIREELTAVLPESAKMPRYHDIDSDQDVISGSTENDWKVFMLELKGAGDAIANRERCPRTVEVLGRIPVVLQAFFSIMDPGKVVPPHRGPSFGFLRYHMAFKVSEEKPPTLRVKDRFHTWKEGECMIFDDTWEHEVLNESPESRVVLIIDVPRPLPWHLRLLDDVIHWLTQRGMDEDVWQDIAERVDLKAEPPAA